jgi:hypothetical protein
MTIDWFSFLVVFAAAIISAVVVVALFATAIRLFATPHRGAPPGAARDEEMDDVEGSRPTGATVGGIVLFVLSGLAVLFGLYLIVPFLHR